MTQGPKNYRIAITALTLAGLISGLSLAVISNDFMVDFQSNVFVGTCFGLALSAGLIFWGLRSVWKIVALVVASIAAWKISSWLTMMALLVWPFGHTDSHWFGSPNADLPPTPSSVFCIGGFTGTFLLFMAVFFLLFPQEKLWRIIAKALAWSLGGAVLAVIGWALGPGLGMPFWSALHPHVGFDSITFGEAPNYISLFLVWQPGMAFLLGIALHRESLRRHRVPASSILARPRQLSSAGIVFFILLTLGVTGYCYNTSLEYAQEAPLRARAKLDAARDKQEAADAPSMENLPDLKPMSANDILILDDSVREYDMDRPSVWAVPASKPKPHNVYFPAPAVIAYSVRYFKQREVPITGEHKRAELFDKVADVSVTQYPNPEWVKFSLKYHHTVSCATPNCEDEQTVYKLGNAILTNGRSNYYWVSGNMLVSLSFAGSEPDSLLSAYLKRYPSSL
jgi:hypothetical protein